MKYTASEILTLVPDFYFSEVDEKVLEQMRKDIQENFQVYSNNWSSENIHTSLKQLIYSFYEKHFDGSNNNFVKNYNQILLELVLDFYNTNSVLNMQGLENELLVQDFEQESTVNIEILVNGEKVTVKQLQEIAKDLAKADFQETEQEPDDIFVFNDLNDLDDLTEDDSVVLKMLGDIVGQAKTFAEKDAEDTKPINLDSNSFLNFLSSLNKHL